MADMFYGKKSFAPFKAMSPPEPKPGSGFYGAITIVRTVDVASGYNQAVVPTTIEERNCMDLGTVEFWALDSEGEIKITNVGVGPAGFNVFLDRFVFSGCKVRALWKYMPHYGY